MKPAPQMKEQRSEQRRPGSGSARVRTVGPHPLEFEGRLIDFSASGFRLAHHTVSLETGTLVEFTHGEARGTARVVWNRIAGDVIETGFFVLARG